MKNLIRRILREKILIEQVEIEQTSEVESILQGKNIIKRGKRGDLVKVIQRALVDGYEIDLGAYGELKDGVDGIFGSKTKKGVKEFQTNFKLAIDGIVGPCTLDTIINGVANKCCESGKCKTEECKDTNFCPAKKNVKIQKTKKSINKEIAGCGRIVPRLPRKFEVIPGGADNFRTNQPSLGQLGYIFEEYPGIETVVRMNAEEGTGVSIGDEKDCVESTGREFVWINAHKGYKPNEGYVESMAVVIPLLMKGNTLIHCTAGKDRTGFMVARYLKDIGYNNWSDEELYQYTVSFNSWERKKYICNKTDYRKYMEGFYTIGDWCDANSARSSCRICRG